MAPDRAVADWVVEHRTPWLTTATRGLMDAGQNPYVVAAIVVGLAAIVLRRGAYREAGATLAAVVMAFGSSAVLKALVGRARPDRHLALVQAHGWTMPSTDAAITAAAAMAVVMAVRWARRPTRIGVALVATAATAVVGLSVVYLGAHWLSDVLAGWLLGALVGLAAARWISGGQPSGPSPVR